MKLFLPSFLKGLGYTGSINDMNWKYFRDQTISTGSLNDLAYKFYGRFNSSLSLNDRYKSWESSIGETPLRATIVGSQIQVNGVDTYFRGINQGTWDENYAPDAHNIKLLGSNVIRQVGVRWWGDSYEAGVDSYSPNAEDHYIDPDHLRQAMQDLDWALTEENTWVVFTFDTDNGAGNRGLGVGIPNFIEASAEGAAKLAEWKIMQKHVIGLLASRPRILFLELMAEPLPTGSSAAHAAPLRDFYRDLITNARTVDTRTPFLIGPRDSYGLNNLAEIYLSERTDVAYTADFLTNKVSGELTIAGQMETFAAFRTTNNVPIFGQQVGRNTSDDTGAGTTSENLGLTAMNGVLSLMNALRIPYTWWQYHQNTDNAGAYALYYKTVYPGQGADNWTPKPGEISSYSYHMTQSGAAIEAAAIAAATAANARLFYIKTDFSNVWQTNDTSTPVTALGQTVGRITPVVGGGNFNQATAGLRPILTSSVNGYAMQFTAASNMWMALDTTYFASGDDSIVIMAFRAAISAANRVLFQTGNSSTTVRNPYVAVLATDEVQASWRGDDNIATGAQSVTTGDDRAIVATASKIGANKKAFVNGVQEGTTDTTAVGTMASITRTRIGATTAGTNGFGGPIALVCISKTMTDEQRRAIERWGAWLIAAPFRGAIPA